MPSKRRNNGRRSRKAATSTVIQSRDDGDKSAAQIDRMISHFRAQESMTTILAKTQFDISAVTTATGYSFSFPELMGTDDVATMAQQYNTFKVKAYRFEVFHTNPTVIVPFVVSTWHGNFVGQPPSTWLAEGSVVDAPDSKYSEPGSKEQKFYWNARGTDENSFQDINTFANYGGIRYFVRAAGTTTYLATVIVTAEIVFRGRH